MPAGAGCPSAMAHGWLSSDFTQIREPKKITAQKRKMAELFKAPPFCLLTPVS